MTPLHQVINERWNPITKELNAVLNIYSLNHFHTTCLEGASSRPRLKDPIAKESKQKKKEEDVICKYYFKINLC